MSAGVGDVVGETGEPLQGVHGLEVPAERGVATGPRRRLLRRFRLRAGARSGLEEIQQHHVRVLLRSFEDDF
jgi:hypothetical protein